MLCICLGAKTRRSSAKIGTYDWTERKIIRYGITVSKDSIFAYKEYTLLYIKS